MNQGTAGTKHVKEDHPSVIWSSHAVCVCLNTTELLFVMDCTWYRMLSTASKSRDTSNKEQTEMQGLLTCRISVGHNGLPFTDPKYQKLWLLTAVGLGVFVAFFGRRM